MSDESVTLAKGLYNDLRGLFRAARGIRNTHLRLTADDAQPCDWKFAKEARIIFSTLTTLCSLVTLIETKMFAPEDECPSCGAKLS